MEPMPTIPGWEEIVLPQAPATTTPLHWGLLVVALAVVFAVVVWLYCRRRPRQRAQRALRRLEKTVAKQPESTRLCLYELRTWLRHGLGVNDLQQAQPTVTDVAAWRDFLTVLTERSFAPQPPSTEAALALTQQARRFLRQGRR
jgi:hypothetical protein